MDIGIGLDEGVGSEGGWQEGIDNEGERSTSVGRIVCWEQVGEERRRQAGGELESMARRDKRRKRKQAGLRDKRRRQEFKKRERDGFREEED